MKYHGRIFTALTTVFIVAAWHISYFLIDQEESHRFFITKGFLIYDFIYTPIILPFFWILGKKYDEAKFLSEKDPLTGLYNRRFISKIFPKLISGASKRMKKIGVLTIDIDNFKAINDNYGHDKGDDVIKGVAATLASSISKGDYAARWGGDEFLVIADLSLVESIHERCESGIQALSRQLNIPVSISIGMSEYPSQGESLDALLKSADQKMYMNKRNAGKM